MGNFYVTLYTLRACPRKGAGLRATQRPGPEKGCLPASPVARAQRVAQHTGRTERDGMLWNRPRMEHTRCCATDSNLRLEGYCGTVTPVKGRPIRHGHSSLKQSITYRTWTGMRQRCFNPNHPHFHRYGGRGITVSQEWAVFDRFLADMGEKPHGMTLERIDNNASYSKENCRWASWKEQAQNRTKRGGVAGTLKWKCRQAGIAYHVAYQRIRNGWEESKALSVPPKLYVTKAMIESVRPK